MTFWYDCAKADSNHLQAELQRRPPSINAAYLHAYYMDNNTMLLLSTVCLFMMSVLSWQGSDSGVWISGWTTKTCSLVLWRDSYSSSIIPHPRLNHAVTLSLGESLALLNNHPDIQRCPYQRKWRFLSTSNGGKKSIVCYCHYSLGGFYSWICSHLWRFLPIIYEVLRRSD